MEVNENSAMFPQFDCGGSLVHSNKTYRSLYEKLPVEEKEIIKQIVSLFQERDSLNCRIHYLMGKEIYTEEEYSQRDKKIEEINDELEGINQELELLFLKLPSTFGSEKAELYDDLLTFVITNQEETIRILNQNN